MSDCDFTFFRKYFCVCVFYHFELAWLKQNQIHFISTPFGWKIWIRIFYHIWLSQSILIPIPAIRISGNRDFCLKKISFSFQTLISGCFIHAPSWTVQFSDQEWFCQNSLISRLFPDIRLFRPRIHSPPFSPLLLLLLLLLSVSPDPHCWRRRRAVAWFWTTALDVSACRRPDPGYGWCRGGRCRPPCHDRRPWVVVNS